MTIPNTQSPTDNQPEKIIGSLNSLLKKKDEKIASLDVMLNLLSFFKAYLFTVVLLSQK